jgi:hypothetical protein
MGNLVATPTAAGSLRFKLSIRLRLLGFPKTLFCVLEASGGVGFMSQVHDCAGRKIRWRAISKAAGFGLGILLILGFAPHPAHAQEMTFRLISVGDRARCGSTCPVVISAEGEITNSTPNAFLSFVESNVGTNNLHAIVFLDSPGGKVLASMEFGKILRELGAAAIVGRVDPAAANRRLSEFVAARCLSACVYALMGAKKRVIPPQSLVGIHRMFSYVDAADPDSSTVVRYRRYDNGEMAAVLERYTWAMGVSPELIAMAERISSDRIHIMSRAEIARFHLAASKF